MTSVTVPSYRGSLLLLACTCCYLRLLLDSHCGLGRPSRKEGDGIDLDWPTGSDVGVTLLVRQIRSILRTDTPASEEAKQESRASACNHGAASDHRTAQRRLR